MTVFNVVANPTRSYLFTCAILATLDDQEVTSYVTPQFLGTCIIGPTPASLSHSAPEPRDYQKNFVAAQHSLSGRSATTFQWSARQRAIEHHGGYHLIPAWGCEQYDHRMAAWQTRRMQRLKWA